MELKTPAAPRLLGKTDDLDDETVRNTKLNAELFHTSNDSVELYRQENNSSDLLGRLYYDDYDSDSMTSPSISGVSSPCHYHRSCHLVKVQISSASNQDHRSYA